VKTIGDGLLATFDGPARAVRAALSLRDGANALGLELRGGAHTGECELIGNDVAGIAVHIAARVQSSVSVAGDAQSGENRGGRMRPAHTPASAGLGDLTWQ
jgi:class 3 adenylate cyclase